MHPFQQLGLVFAGSAGLILNGLGQSVMGPALPTYVRQFALGEGGAGLLISAFWIGALACIGVLLLWPGRIRERSSFSLLAAGAGLLGLEWGWPLVLAGAALFGFGSGAIAVLFNRRFLTDFGANGPSMLGFLNAVYCLGAIGGPLLFVAVGTDAGRTYLIVAGLAALAALIVRSGPQAAADAGGTTRLRPGVLLFGIAAIGFEAAMIGLGPTALIAEGVGEVEASRLASLFFVAYLAARLASIWLARWLEPFTLFLLCIGGAGLSALAGSMTHPGLFYVISGGFVALVFPAYFTFATQAFGPGPRTAPIVMAGGLLGGIFVPPLVEPAMAASGADAFAVLAGLAIAVALAALAVLVRPGRRAAA